VRVGVVGRQVGQPHDELGLVGRIRRPPRLHPLQLGRRLPLRQQLDLT
jgi:hypothetical protein